MQIQSYSLDKSQSRIKYQTRVKLIQLVVNDKLSIKKACKLLNINYSTGKLIMKKYTKDGSITKFSHQKLNNTRLGTKTDHLPLPTDSSTSSANNNINQWPITNQNFPIYQTPYMMWVNSSTYEFPFQYRPDLAQNGSVVNQNFGNGFCWIF